MTELTIREAIEKTAQKAGLAAAARQPDAAIVTQRRQDFVTEADFESEQIIMETLGEHFPDVPFLSEEAGGEELREGLLFVVDPIDGTVNFFRQDPFWGISIALVEDEVPIVGAICMPRLDALFSATQGEQATVTKLSTGEKSDLIVTHQAQLIEARVWYDLDLKRTKEELLVKRFLALKKGTTQPTSRGSAVAGPAALAWGWCDAYYHSGPKPFDMAAGGLIVQQADGVVTDIDGNPWKAFSRSFVASNGILHDELLELLNG